eukprot:XP_020400033.1 uncharacterized protein LOC109942436 [Zea mays]
MAPPSPGVPDPVPVLAVAAWRGPGSPARGRGAPSPRRPRAAPLLALSAWPRAVRPRWLTGAAVRVLSVAARPRSARRGALPVQLARPWRGPVRRPWRLSPARLGVPRPCAARPRPGAASARAAMVPLRSAARALLGPGVTRPWLPLSRGAPAALGRGALVRVPAPARRGSASPRPSVPAQPRPLRGTPARISPGPGSPFPPTSRPRPAGHGAAACGPAWRPPPASRRGAPFPGVPDPAPGVPDPVPVPVLAVVA